MTPTGEEEKAGEMVLSDRSIKEEIAKGRIIIEPLDTNCIQPASIDVHLDRKLLVFKTWRHPFYIDVKQNTADLTEMVELEDGKPFFLQPGEFVLGSTLEYIALPDDIVARLEGKSSLGRIGILIHSTAGYVDPGWRGHLTLELSNVAKLPVTLYYRMKIGQISFHRLTSPVDQLYGSAGLGSKYQDQREPTASRYFWDFETEA
jgi:dCTP deaminase